MNTIQNCKEFCERYKGKIIAVTNRSLVNEGSFCEQIEKIGQTKPDSIILREKDMSLSEYTLLAEKILDIADRNNIRCILHNFPDAAIQLNYRNIHMPLGELKALADNGGNVKENVAADEAEKIKAQLEEAGAEVELVNC